MTNYQKLVLAELLSGNLELIQDTSEGLFTTNSKEAKLYSIILQYLDVHNKLPNKAAMIAEITDRAPASVRGGFIAIVESLPDKSGISNDELIAGLKNSKVLREVDDRIEALVMAQRDRNVDEVRNLLSETLLELSTGNVKLTNFKDAANSDEEINFIPSGLGSEYDDKLGGGFAGVTLITASSGGGKTSVMLASAIESFKSGKKVLFISLELSPKALYARMESYLTKIDFKRVLKGELTADERKLIDNVMNEFWGDREDDFTIVSDNMNDTELLSLVSVQAQVHGMDACYIDYLGLIGSATNTDSWKSLSIMVKKLHQYTIQFGIVVVTASQVADVKIEGTTVELKSRGSAELVFSSSIAIYFKHDESGESTTFYMAKNRFNKLTANIFEPQLQYMCFNDLGIEL